MLITENKRARVGCKRYWLAFAVSLIGLSAPVAWAQAPGQPYPGQPGAYPQNPYPPNGPYQPVNYGGQPGGWTQAQGAPVQQQVQHNPQVATRQGSNPQAILDWFQRYDAIRRQAQMNPADRQKADALMSKGISMFIPGDEKVATQKLLNNLVGRYATASEEMKRLPLYPETERLHRGYYQYFANAKDLFGDYLKVQDNIMVKDASGNALAATLMNRKQSLETLDTNNKALDAQLRSQFGIPPYKY